MSPYRRRMWWIAEAMFATGSWIRSDVPARWFSANVPGTTRA
ncbi:hypothetical protein [Streptomyces sp. NPDC003401]